MFYILLRRHRVEVIHLALKMDSPLLMYDVMVTSFDICFVVIEICQKNPSPAYFVAGFTSASHNVSLAPFSHWISRNPCIRLNRSLDSYSLYQSDNHYCSMVLSYCIYLLRFFVAATDSLQLVDRASVAR